jgi:hypothetical protein
MFAGAFLVLSLAITLYVFLVIVTGGMKGDSSETKRMLEALPGCSDAELEAAAAEAAAESVRKASAAKVKADEARELFEALDADGTGTLGIEEVGGLARALGQHLADGELAEAMRKMDDDSSGEVSFSEFLSYMQDEDGLFGRQDAAMGGVSHGRVCH